MDTSEIWSWILVALFLVGLIVFAILYFKTPSPTKSTPQVCDPITKDACIAKSLCDGVGNGPCAIETCLNNYSGTLTKKSECQSCDLNTYMKKSDCTSGQCNWTKTQCLADSTGYNLIDKSKCSAVQVYRTELIPGDKIDLSRGLFSSDKIEVGTLMYTISVQGFPLIMKYNATPVLSWVDENNQGNNINPVAVRANSRWKIVRAPTYPYSGSGSPISSDAVEYVRLTLSNKLVYKVNGIKTWLVGRPGYGIDIPECNGEFYYPGTTKDDVIEKVKLHYNGNGENDWGNYGLLVTIKDKSEPKFLGVLPYSCPGNSYSPIPYKE